MGSFGRVDTVVNNAGIFILHPAPAGTGDRAGRGTSPSL
jgi:hypothetical protein